LAYLLYGKFLDRQMGADDLRKTPSVEINDGVDFVPAPTTLLLGSIFLRLPRQPRL